MEAQRIQGVPMSSIPEGAQTASGEGPDLKSAVTEAAKTLGLSPAEVEYKLDMSHFRSAAGMPMSRSTVKVVAWSRPEGAAAAPAPAPRPAAAPAEPRPPREAPAPRPAREPVGPGAKTPASEFAEGWFRMLLTSMDVVGTVEATEADGHIHLAITADKAGRIIGRRGVTLSAIRHLLKLALSSHGDFVIDVDIPDARDGDGPRPEREPRGDDRGPRRDDRGPRADGPRRDDRGPRRDDRGPRRDDRRPDDGPKSEYPEEKLVAIAKRAAEKVVETGRPVTINLVLNSYDRRIVHVTVQDLDGVESQSVLKDGKKYIQVLPTGSADNAGE
jgi:predicted RNA-binding protein Jag